MSSMVHTTIRQRGTRLFRSRTGDCQVKQHEKLQLDDLELRAALLVLAQSCKELAYATVGKRGPDRNAGVKDYEALHGRLSK